LLDDKEAVQQLERQRRHGEEIEGDDDLPVILQKHQPPFTQVASALNSTQIPGHSPLRDNEAELRDLAMDLGGLPSPDSPLPPIGSAVGSHRWPSVGRRTCGIANASTVGAGTAPSDDGLGLYDDEHVAPAWPEVAERRPEQSIQGVQYRARPLAFEHGNLLSKGKDFKGRVTSALAEDAENREHGQDEFTHEFSLVTRRNAALPTQSRWFSTYWFHELTKFCLRTVRRKRPGLGPAAE
jgi:hypothetical protein